MCYTKALEAPLVLINQEDSVSQLLSAGDIPALLHDDIRRYGCFSCEGKEFGTNSLSENGSGLWRCISCDAWQVVVSKANYGDRASIAVGYFGYNKPREDQYPIVVPHPAMFDQLAVENG